MLRKTLAFILLAAWVLAGCHILPVAQTTTTTTTTPAPETTTTTTAVAAVSDAAGLILKLTAMTPSGDTYLIEGILQQYQTIPGERMALMEASRDETVQIDGGFYYLVNRAAYLAQHPGNQPADWMGYLYARGEDWQSPNVAPAFHVVQENGVFNIIGEDSDYRPRLETGTLSLTLAPHARLILLTIRDTLEEKTVTAQEFYQIYESLGQGDPPEDYYLGGMQGSGFLCDVQDNQIVRLAEIYMP